MLGDAAGSSGCAQRLGCAATRVRPRQLPRAPGGTGFQAHQVVGPSAGCRRSRRPRRSAPPTSRERGEYLPVPACLDRPNGCGSRSVTHLGSHRSELLSPSQEHHPPGGQSPASHWEAYHLVRGLGPARKRDTRQNGVQINPRQRMPAVPVAPVQKGQAGGCHAQSKPGSQRASVRLPSSLCSSPVRGGVWLSGRTECRFSLRTALGAQSRHIPAPPLEPRRTRRHHQPCPRAELPLKRDRTQAAQG